MTKNFMHIGIDASRIALTERTGTENYTYNLIEAIKRVDKENRYTLYFNKLPQYFEINQTNISTKYIPLPRLWTQVRLALECLVNPPDVLFVPAHTLPVIRWPKLRTVVTVHDLGSEFLEAHHQFPQRLYLNWSTLFSVRSASQIIAVSKSTKSDLVSKLRVDAKKINVVYEGIDRSYFFPRSETEINRVKGVYGINKPYFLFVGTVQPRKNIERLIEAFSLLKTNKINLVIAGKPGWLYDDIYNAPKRLGIADKVNFLGFVEGEDLPALYSGALAFVYPSLYEGFGLPLLEAMACNTPVVASKSSSIPEVVGKSGLLFNPTNINEIAESLRKIASGRTLRGKLIGSSQEELSRFDWDKTAQETVKVFEKVYEQK